MNIFDDFDKFFIGFNDQFNRVNKIKNTSGNFPPYNIIKVSDNTYMIELAVAGFGPSDITVEVLERNLIVSTQAPKETYQPADYIVKGIASRQFTRSFLLDEGMEVKEASIEHGLLRIRVERKVPEESKPKRIEIVSY